MKCTKKIKQEVQKYFHELNKNDFSHSFSHVERVTLLAKQIGKKEGADLEVLEAACLLHDIAREKEDKGLVEDHALEGSKMARKILNKIGYPKNKINNVCHSILVHRWKKNGPPETLEARILQDADRLDALGAVDVARVIASSIQSKKYKCPIYVDEPYTEPSDGKKSAIHYLIEKLKEPKRRPESYNTETAKKIAQKRHQFSKKFVDRFIKEWRGNL
jgi:uncharacterized protein